MNGGPEPGPNGQNLSTQQINHALEIVYNARSTNHERQEATQYLEQLKTHQSAPYHGFELAVTTSHPPIVRHYGLSLLDHTIRFRWSEYSQEESKALRDWILRLAQNATLEDPSFLANKVAEIWVELAKRSWALDWMDMDENLVQLWNGKTAQKNLVLIVLTTLSEEVFSIEDTVVALRDTELNKACVDIFTPVEILEKNFTNRDNGTDIRCGRDGWVTRLASALRACTADGGIPDELADTVLKTLQTFKSIVGWIVLGALVATESLTPVFTCLKIGNPSIQLV